MSELKISRCPECGQDIFPRTFTLQQVAKILGIEYSTAHGMWHRGQIEGYQYAKNGNIIVTEESLNKLLERSKRSF